MSRRYIIVQNPPLETFRRAAQIAGLSHAVTFPPEGNFPYQEAWSLPGRAAVLQFVFERPLDLCYFFVEGDPTAVALVMSHMVQEVAYLSLDAVMTHAAAAVDGDARVRGCNALAVLESDFTPEIFELLCERAADGDETVRTAAVRALGYLRWEQARPLFEARMSDESRFVREAARLSLGDLALPPPAAT